MKIIARDNFGQPTWKERVVVENIRGADTAWALAAAMQAKPGNAEFFCVVPDSHEVSE